MSQSHGHSDYIIFSVYQGKVDDALAHKGIMASFDFSGIKYQECEGVYMGQKEESIIINADHEPLVLSLCRDYNQECYMIAETHKHGLRKAYFVYLDDGRKEFMGYLRSVSRERALESDGYTYRPDMDKYWIITEDDDTMVA